MKNILLTAMIFLASCTSKSSYEENFILLTLLSVADTPDAQAACENYMASSENCLVNSANPPAPINETSLSFIMSSGSYSTYPTYCSSLLASDAFASFSERARECIMDCQKEYWDGRISAGTCGEDFATQLSGLTEGSSACITDCFTLLNN